MNWNTNVTVEQLEKSLLPIEVKEKIDILEDEIGKEFFKKQHEKLGIKSLGNEIRYNEIISCLFNNVSNNIVLIKLTENKRAFIKNFVDVAIKYANNEVYLFILENEFGINSRLVDKSFIRIDELLAELQSFFSVFSLIHKNLQITIIELKGFTKFRLETVGNYTKIHSNEH